MVTELAVTGNGSWRGSRSAIVEYSISEESTPIAGGDLSGAVGGGSFRVAAGPETILLHHDEIELTDGSNGRIALRVAGLTLIDDFEAPVEVDAKTIQLIARKRIPPYTGTLGGWLGIVFDACGITGAQRLIAPAVASRAVSYPGFFGVAWEVLKQVCAAQQIEIALVSSLVVVRAIRERNATLRRIQPGKTRTVGVGEMAKSIEVVSYSNQYRASGLVYPTGGWNEDVEVFQVGAGEVLETEVEVDVSVMSVAQPTAVASVSREHASSSVYTVTGGDGLPVPPQQWRDYGGKVEVEVGEDFRTLRLKITGARQERYAPYSISMASGTSDHYSSLRIVGSGVWVEERREVVGTGADPETTSDDVGVTVEIPFAATAAQAASLAVSAAQRYTGLRQSFSATARSINAANADGIVARLDTIAFNTLYAGKTAAQFGAEIGSRTASQFNALLFDLVKDNFENQAFGNLGGSRFEEGGAMWRIRNATITPEGQSFTAEPDTTAADFNAKHAGLTAAQFNARFAGLRVAEFDLTPLRG